MCDGLGCEWINSRVEILIYMNNMIVRTITSFKSSFV